MAKVTGGTRHVQNLRGKFSPRKLALIGAKLYEAGELVQRDAQLSITTGAVSGAGHVASAPGEAPNADTHVLDQSIETNQITQTKVEVSANAPYAVALEFGTSRMAERPYMRPALEKNRGNIARLVKEAIDIKTG